MCAQAKPYHHIHCHSTAGSPPTTNKKQVIIWYQANCPACQASQGLFREIAEAGKNSSHPWDTTMQEVTEAATQKFKHLLYVPLYDIVEADPESSSPYGPGTRLQTVRNTEEELMRAFSTLPRWLTAKTETRNV